MASQPAKLLVVVLRVVQVDEVVMRAYRKIAAVCVVAHDFDPLLGVVQLLVNFVEADESAAIGCVDVIDDTD